MASMDYVFQITDQTTGTVTLTSSPYSYYSGGILTANRNQRTVSDTLTVRLKDGAGTANLDEIRTLNKLLKQAEDAQGNRALNRVYLTWKETASGSLWRSEIVGGRAEPREDSLTMPYWSNDRMFSPVYLERLNYWEGAEAQIPLTNPNGTATTNALPVFGQMDGRGTAPALHINYIDLPGTAITGDLPGATRIEMTNPGTAVASTPFQIWIGQNYTNPGNYTTWNYEAESATLNAGGTISGVSTAYSGSAYITTGSIGTVYTDALNWTIPGSILSAAGGRPFHVMATFTPLSDFYYFHYRIKLVYDTDTVGGYVTEYLGPTVYLENPNNAVNDMGIIYLPPSLSGSGMSDLELILQAYPHGADTTFQMDSLQLIPADGWRYLFTRSLVNQRLIDDGVRLEIYLDDGSGTNKHGGVQGEGSPIMLKPSTDQRLYFMMDSNYSSTPLDLQLNVKIYYRPRRLTI